MTTKRPAVDPDGIQTISWPTIVSFGVLAVCVLFVLVYVASGPPQQSVARTDAKADARPKASPVPEPSPPAAEPAKAPTPEPQRTRDPERTSKPERTRDWEPNRSPVAEPPSPLSVASRERPRWKRPSSPLDVPAFPDDDGVTSSRPKAPFDSGSPSARNEKPPMPAPPPREQRDVAAEPTQPPAAGDPAPVPDNTPPSIPDKATILAKTKEVRQVFKDDYANRDPNARAAFAERLATSAYQTTRDSAMAYVLATEARDQAMQAGEVQIFTDAGNFLTDTFGIDTHDDDIVAFGRLQNLSGRSAEWYGGLLDEINRRVAELVARDDFDRAVRYASVGKTIASKAADTATAQEWTTRIKDLSTLRTQFGSYKSSRQALQENPDDAAANTKWGTYLCFLKGDFAAGLPHLAKGSDAAMAALAKRDMTPSGGVAEAVALADEWWDYGEKSKAFRTHARQHAGELYRAVLPNLSGLALAKTEKRLSEIEPVSTGGMGGNPVEQILMAGPWLIRWERVVGLRDRFPPNRERENQDEDRYEETIRFLEGGQVESRFFVSWEIRNEFLELTGREFEAPLGGAGGPPFGDNRDRQFHGRAVLVGTELRLIAYRGDHIDRPIFRGVGTRQPAE